MKPIRIGLLVAVVVAIVLFFVLGYGEYLTLDYLKEQRDRVLQLYNDHPVLTILAFIAVYVLLTSLSIPSATGLTLLAGALFDLFVGVIVVAVASTCGATFAFLLARYFFRDVVQTKFSKQLGFINRGMDRDGIFYLFAIRVAPAIPYFVVNAAMGLTTIRLWPYFWVSGIGMLGATTVFVNAGSQLGRLESFSGILSPGLMLALLLLGIFPLAVKLLLRAFGKLNESENRGDL